ncbi:hypothetical protein G9A89_017374 [Geosiphon pyriformis]|nr:hypothetical protein G9A89_017374 [Geosiphon pyriformis]
MIKKTKSSEKWGQSLAFAIVTPNFFVVSNEISNKISVVSFSILSKMSQDQPLAVLPNVVSSGRLLPVLEVKQTFSVVLFVFKNWADQIETKASPSLVFGAAINIIVINSPPALPIAKQQQQSQLLPQQQIQQQPQQQPMAYTSIAKIEKFTGEKDDTQILNQFICGLHSSLLQRICLMHPQTPQNAVTNIRDFELAELEANHAQAINLVINESFNLDSKLKQLITTLSNLLAPTNSNTAIELTSKQNSKAETDTTKLEINLGIGYTQNPNFQFYLSLLVTPEDATFNNPESSQKQLLTSNIPPATISHDKSLAAIFPFELEVTTIVLLFSRAVLDTKLITAMYTDVKVDSYVIKLILDSGSAGSIIT